jgi:hypothetical protein
MVVKKVPFFLIWQIFGNFFMLFVCISALIVAQFIMVLKYFYGAIHSPCVADFFPVLPPIAIQWIFIVFAFGCHAQHALFKPSVPTIPKTF